MVYYNELDPFAAAWLRELITTGHIAKGEVDERSIVDVRPDDLRGFTQCHFFAGIGGWSYALRLAGWPDDRPVWTGSCPCQPFSQAGRGKGEADARHLWPEFRRLIAECRPATIFGEQVASAAGRRWLAGVYVDLEALAYRRAGADLCAASAGAPHIRQRLWWVAGATSGLGNADIARSQGWSLDTGEYSDQWSPWETGEPLPCADGVSRRVEPGLFPLAHGVPRRVGRLRGYGNAIVPQIAATFITAYCDCY